MGLDLHYSIIEFFERRMAEHSAVEWCRHLPSEGNHVYEIKRKKFGDVIRVWLADQYVFGEQDFYNRPKEIRPGDYILIAKPEANETSESYPEEKIRIGKLVDFMGALTKREMWKYEPPTQEEREKRQARYKKAKR
jgi:hypothetical protein